jgi:hypothetical protein
VAGLYFFFIVFNLAGQLLTNFAGFVIPGYYSMEALFTTSKADDTQWLTVRCDTPSPPLTRNLTSSSTGLSLPFSRKSTPALSTSRMVACTNYTSQRC